MAMPTKMAVLTGRMENMKNAPNKLPIPRHSNSPIINHHEILEADVIVMPHDPSSATAVTRRANCNRDAPPPLAFAPGWALLKFGNAT